MLVERHHEYPREVVSAILEHHEQLDGGGYPRGLSAEKMSPLGRVLSLAEVVTAMHGRGATDPELRLSVALRMNRHRYDQELAQVLLELLAEYPTRASSATVGDPVGELNEVQGLLQGWAAVAAAQGPAAVLERATERLAEMRRALAGAGAWSRGRPTPKRWSAGWPRCLEHHPRVERVARPHGAYQVLDVVTPMASGPDSGEGLARCSPGRVGHG